MIARPLRDKLERGEPITIENFVIDPINGKKVISQFTEIKTKAFHVSIKLILEIFLRVTLSQI